MTSQVKTASRALGAPVFVFPGQGPQTAAMFDGLRDRPEFPTHHALLCDIVGTDVVGAVSRLGETFLQRNEIASLVTVFASSLELARLRREGIVPQGVAGYSVGQWMAMAAADMLSIETLLATVWRRAQLMNATEGGRDGSMLAVIGLPTEQVETVCASVVAQGDPVAVSNYNCVGQLTLAGTRRGIALVQASLAALKPKKMVAVAAAGAWHSPLLRAAVSPFRAFLDTIALRQPKVPVMDNVTGKPLPADPSALRDTLSQHLAQPVRWDACVRTLLAAGAGSVVEVGYGDMLSKFGFFIDRRVQHVPSYRMA